MIPAWQQAEVQDYDLQLTDAPKTILDIGACVGAWSARAHSQWPNAKIIAYEPVMDNCAEFHRNCHGPNIQLAYSAVRGHCGVDKLFVGIENTTGGFFQIGGQTKNTITVTCLYAGALPPSDLVKIDTEGSEVEILEHLNLDSTRAIICEYHSEENGRRVKEIAATKGFLLHHDNPGTRGHGIAKFGRPGAIKERMKPTALKLFVAVPVYGGMPIEFVQSLLKLYANPPCNMELKFMPGDSLVCRARNSLAAAFLKSDCTHMLQIDSDLIFSTNHILRLLEHGKDVIGGFYPKKKEGPIEWVCNAIAGKLSPDANGLQEVRYIGTGFLLVTRNALDMMIAKCGNEIAYHPDHAPKETEWDLWPVGPYRAKDGHTRYLSEDWFFCQRWIDMGGTVWGDARVILKHVGIATYPLQTQLPELLTPKMTAAAPSDTAAGPATAITATRDQEAILHEHEQP